MKKSSQSNPFEFVLSCTKIKIGSIKQDALLPFFEQEQNWNEIIRTSLDHGVGNLVYKILNSYYSNIVPKPVMMKMKNRYFLNSFRNLVMGASLLKTLELFNQNDIQAIPFKGLVQSELIFHDIGTRVISDLDILIKQAHAQKAKRLLIKHGFAISVEIPNSQLSFYIKKENFFQFFDKDQTLNIDLHWEMTGRYGQKALYFPDSEQELSDFYLLGRNIKTLSLENTLIHLCIHSASHCWEKLESIYSVAIIVSSGDIKEWDGVFNRAKKMKCLKTVLLGLYLSEYFFQIDLPKSIIKYNRQIIEQPLEYIVEKITQGVTAYTETLSWRFSPFHFQIRDSLADKISYFFRLFFQPTIKEWERFPLPDHWLFLYYILRPYRIIKEGLSK